MHQDYTTVNSSLEFNETYSHHKKFLTTLNQETIAKIMMKLSQISVMEESNGRGTMALDRKVKHSPLWLRNTIHILIFFDASLQRSPIQYDARNAFLHGESAEEIYMKITPGYN